MGIMMARRRPEYKEAMDSRQKQIVKEQAKEAARLEEKAEGIAIQEEKAEKKKKIK